MPDERVINKDTPVTWTISDQRGNTVTFQAGTLAQALDTAYDTECFRRVLHGNAEHWEIRNSLGEHHPIQREYKGEYDD